MFRIRGQFLTGFILASVFCLFTQASLLKAQQIKVDSADPSAAVQGTTNLNVTIKGSGFKAGATSKFLITGTDLAGGITVNSTTYVNSTTLVSNIDVAVDAVTTSKFDIAVTSGGRTGKGIEKFAVTEKVVIDYVGLDVFIDCSIGDNICSDGYGEYVNGVDGVGGGLDINGNINFNFSVYSPSTGVSTRQAFFNFGDNAISGATAPSAGTGLYYSVIRSAPAADPYAVPVTSGDCLYPLHSGPVPIQTMTYGQCQFVQMGWALYTQDLYPRWRLQFQNGDADGDDNTSYVLVACTESNSSTGKCSQWSVEPGITEWTGTSGSAAYNSALLVEVAYANARGGKTTVTKKGYFNMPFHLTLVARP